LTLINTHQSPTTLIVNEQETQLWLVSRAMYLCKCNGGADLKKNMPLPICVTTPNLVILR